MTEHDTTTRMPVSPRSAEEAVRGYLATWNVIDEDDRGRLLDQFWSPEVSYTDPLMSLTGRNELEAAIAGVHEQFPGMSSPSSVRSTATTPNCGSNGALALPTRNPSPSGST